MFPEKCHDFLDNSSTDYFSVLHLNIRSIKENINNFKLFLTSITFTFKVICFSETWLDDLLLSGDASYELPNYKSRQQVRSDRKGDGISIYIHNSLNFKIRPDLSIRNNDIESLSAGIFSDKVRNTNVLYRPPNGQIEPFENFKQYFFPNKSLSKNFLYY